MQIINQISHLIDFHGKASRTEFIQVLFGSYAYFAALSFFAIHEITFDFGAVGFFGFVAANSLSILIFVSAICRRHMSAGLPEEYFLLLIGCQIALVLLRSFDGLGQFFAAACVLYSLGYYLVLCAVPSK